MSDQRPLHGLRVVELTGRPGAARLLGRLLVDLGAEVDAFTTEPAAADAWDTWVQAGKNTVTGELHHQLTVADAVVTDHTGHQLLQQHDSVGRKPLEVCLSPYGLTGPLAGQPASELTLEALAGFLLANGNEGDAPRPTGVALGRATAALAGLVALLAYGEGASDCVDIAELDTLVSYLGTLLPPVALTGNDPRRIGNRHGMAAPWNVYPTADAPVVVCTMGEQMWRRLTEVIGRPELAADGRFLDTASRVANVDALDASISAWSRQQPSATLVQQLTEADIPVARLRTPAEVRGHRLTAERSLVTDTGAPHSPVASLTPKPMPGGAPRRPRAPMPGKGPLAGLRVVELGAYTAAPLAARLLADLGADVVKVEPPHGEGSRRLAQRIDDVGYLFFVNNAGKHGCRLDLADATDRQRFDQLLTATDVVLTNLSAAALDAADLGAESVLAQRSLVYCQLTGYGRAGVGAGLRAFDTAVQAESGVLLTLPDAPAMKAAVSLADVAGAYLAAAATLLGVRRHRQTGAGQLLDVAMYDAAVWSTFHRWFADEATKEPPAETLHPTTDGTVALSAPGPAELAAFVAEADGSLDTSTVLRHAAAAGVAAAPVLGVKETAEHSQVTARGSVVRQTYGDTPVLITGAPFHSAADPPTVAPVLPTDVSWKDEEP
ncbi:MAG: hypothetical protein GEV07_03300 [Streptosporangiales bacterium]|nr:hypothetical protein [Streptosporangiales bacterium]